MIASHEPRARLLHLTFTRSPATRVAGGSGMAFDVPESIETGAKVGGGVLLLELIRKGFAFFKSRHDGEVQLTARIVEDGADLRRELIEENRRMSELNREATERAHKFELAHAIMSGDKLRLERQLERKDEQIRLLSEQLDKLRQRPATTTESSPV